MKETPVNPITSAGVNPPTAEVIACPDISIIGLELISIEPFETVAETPVSPITSAGEIAPTEDVNPIPVKGCTIAGSTEPKLTVAETPDIAPAGPNSNPKVRRLDVADTPQTLIVGLNTTVGLPVLVVAS